MNTIDVGEYFGRAASLSPCHRAVGDKTVLRLQCSCVDWRSFWIASSSQDSLIGSFDDSFALLEFLLLEGRDGQ